MQPVVNRQQAARMRNDRIEQLTQAVSIASKVKSSEPIRKSQLPTVE
jgi:LPS O-antigen subunit length determinant protein (WzzB/FepE family)